MRASRIAAAFAALLLLNSITSSAQDTWDGPAPAHLSVVEGVATVSRDVNREDAVAGLPIVPGDVIRTDRGRAKIMFPDGSVVDLDEFSTFELLSASTCRLSEGRLLLSVPEGGGTSRLTIETPQAAAEIAGPGQYRVAMDGTPSGLQTVVEVLRGNATLFNERGSTVLRSGEQSVAYDAAAPTYARSFDTRRLDALDEWSASVRDDRGTGLSAQYLPSDLRSYSGLLDRHGSWAYEAPYGYVWYPTVAPDWRPYGDGYWSSMPAFGWTWIGTSRWSWPTHHYGRWGYQRSRWYWIPDRRWGPAWVSWGAAPGYVSWSPLGYNNQPVFAFSVSTGSGYGWGAGWTVINRNYFGGRRWNVRQYSVTNLPSRTPFILQTTAPPAVSRGSVGRWSAGGGRGRINSSTGYAVPRSASPSNVPDRGRDSRRSDSVASIRTTRPPDSSRRNSGRDAATSSSPGVSYDTSPRAVPRAAPRSDAPAPSVIYSTPPPSRGGHVPNGRTRPEAQGRSVDAPPPPAPSSFTGSVRARSRDSNVSAAPPSPAPPRRGDVHGGEPSGSSSGSVGRAMPRAERGGGQVGQAPSSAGGGRAQGPRR